MIQWIVPSLIFLPAAAFATLVTCVWLKLRPSESTINRIVAAAFGTNVLLCIAAGLWLLVNNRSSHEIVLGNFFVAEHYAFEWKVILDGLSLTFVTLTSILVGLIGAFSRRYLHRESGYLRFFFLLTLFGAGTTVVALAGSLDLIFFGWEIVGFTSTLLIAFFYKRTKPIEHGLRAFITYRLCDLGLLAAAIWMHHTIGGSEMFPVGDDGGWFAFKLPGDATNTTVIGFMLLWPAMGKSAQVPLGGWLPRAREGPTPSSAIFYGAISIHLGPYLLLRAAPCGRICITTGRGHRPARVSVGRPTLRTGWDCRDDGGYHRHRFSLPGRRTTERTARSGLSHHESNGSRGLWSRKPLIRGPDRRTSDLAGALSRDGRLHHDARRTGSPTWQSRSAYAARKL